MVLLSRRLALGLLTAGPAALMAMSGQAKAQPANLAANSPANLTGGPEVWRSDRLGVETLGAGPDVMLIPGLGSSREVWRPLAVRLSATHRVHLVQALGFAGESWRHEDGAFLAPFVDHLRWCLEDAGRKRVAVIGHSMGGLAGLLLAQARPDLVGRVMTVDSLPFYSAMFGPGVTPDQAKPFADQAAAAIRSAAPEAFEAQQRQMAAALARDPATRDAIVQWSVASNRSAMASAMRDVMLTDARPGLAAMNLPVTALYASDAEGGTPAAMADALWGREYAALPGVRLIRVDGSRHFIMADQPARFGELVDDFLK